MRVLVACEFSGRVRDAFAAMGHDAWSCDLLPSETPGQHIQGDVLSVIEDYWDAMIGHPPCTFTALCQIWRKYKPGQEWRKAEEEEAILFFAKLWRCKIPRICLEQPMSVISTRVAPKTQTIHPHWFGHGETKTTWLWLKNLPPLVATNKVEGREPRVHHEPPSPERWKNATAMAAQWGKVL